MERGADINAFDYNKWTPLHWAARYNNNVDVLKLLIEKGADVNSFDDC